MDRPYRDAMPHEVAFSILQKDAQNGLIDPAILAILKEEVSKNIHSIPIYNS